MVLQVYCVIYEYSVVTNVIYIHYKNSIRYGITSVLGNI
jgi:hypothetical protein